MSISERLKQFTSAPDQAAFWAEHIAGWYTTQTAICTPELKLADMLWSRFCTAHGQPEAARAAFERMILTDSIPGDRKGTLLAAIDVLARPLPAVCRVRMPDMPDAGFFRATNPSIIQNPTGGYLVCVRHVNYHCNEQNEYHCNDPKETVVRTRNTIYTLSDALEVQEAAWLEDKCTFFRYPSMVRDLEDVRLVPYYVEPHVLATCTSREVMHNTMPQIMLTRVNLATRCHEGGQRLLAHEHPLQGQCQKNWLAWVDAETKQLLCIYAFGPRFVIYEVSPVTGACTVWRQWETGLAFQYVRGSSAPVPFGERGYVCVVHYAYDQHQTRRHYFHRFVFLDAVYRPVAISESWVLTDGPRGIEFVISAAPHPDGLVLGFGKNDVEAYLEIVAPETILNLRYFKI